MLIEDFRFNGDDVFFVGHNGPTLTAILRNGTIIYQGNPDPTQGGSVMSISGFKFSQSQNGDWMILVGTSIHRNWEVAFVYDNKFNIIMRLPVGRNQEDCFSLGVYAQNCVVGDLTGNGDPELVIPSDHVGLCNFNSSGLPVFASSVFEENYGNYVNWGRIVTDSSFEHELSGWQVEPPDVDYNLYFTQGIATGFKFSDPDGENYSSIAIVGKYCDEDIHGYPIWGDSVLFLYFADSVRGREQFYVPKYNWDWRNKHVVINQKRGTHVINQARMAPAIVDLTGDGLPEIVLPMDDTKIHAFNLKQEEIGYFPYQIPQCKTTECMSDPKSVGGCSYADTEDEHYCADDQTAVYGSEIVAFQRPNEGPIIVFGTLPGYNNNFYVGKIIFLYYNGRELKIFDLPPTANPPVHKFNGIRPCPTLFRKESNSNLFLNVQTILSYNMLYEINNTKEAKILWGSSRGNFQRTGFLEKVVEVYPFNEEQLPSSSSWEVVFLSVFIPIFVLCSCLLLVLVLVILVLVFYFSYKKKRDDLSKIELE